MRILDSIRKGREKAQAWKNREKRREAGVPPWWVPANTVYLRDPPVIYEYDTPQDALDDLARGIDKREFVKVPNPDGVEPGWAVPYIREAIRDAIAAGNKEIYEREMNTPLFPQDDLPVAMRALKGAPTNNVGAYLEWKQGQVHD